MKAKTKKVITGVAAMMLIATISLGGTFAYLTRITERRVNNFTFASKSLNAMLTEPEWDGIIGYEYDPNWKYVRPIYPDDEEGTVYGYFTPKDSAEKQPIRYTPEDLKKKYEDGSLSAENPALNEWYDALLESKDGGVISYDDYERPSKATDTDFNPDDNYGYLRAQNMIPGQTAKKNPFVTNTGELDEWIAVRVSFLDTDGNLITGDNFKNITDIIRVSWTSDRTTADEVLGVRKWYYLVDDAADEESLEAKRLSNDTGNYLNQMIFYYDEPLTTSGETQKTVPLFTSITVDPDATNEQIKLLEAMGGFSIYLEGYAIQKNAYETTTENDVTTTGAAKWVTSNRAVFSSIAASTADHFGVVPAESPAGVSQQVSE